MEMGILDYKQFWAPFWGENGVLRSFTTPQSTYTFIDTSKLDFSQFDKNDGFPHCEKQFFFI